VRSTLSVVCDSVDDVLTAESKSDKQALSKGRTRESLSIIVSDNQKLSGEASRLMNSKSFVATWFPAGSATVPMACVES